MARAALSQILSQLHGCTQTKPDQWQARCPYHKGGDEENASFGVTIRDNGQILLNCFRGCRPEHYWPVLGITNADVAPDSLPRLHDPARPARRDDRTPPEEWEVRCAAWAEFFAKSSAARSTLAQALTLPESVLNELPGVGVWNDHKKGPCWTFPERDSQGRVVGVGLRFRDGKKLSAPGSARGLSLPLGWKDRPGPLYLVEGPSDTLAMSAAGLAAIGRPSNVGGVKLLAELIRAEVPADRRLVWLGENDRKPDASWPGRDESRKAAAKLAAEIGRTVEFALPPNAHEKDMRAWFTGLVLDGCQWEEMAARVEMFLKTVPIAPARLKKPATIPTSDEIERVHIHHPLGGDESKTVDDVITAMRADTTLFTQAGGRLVHVVCKDGDPPEIMEEEPDGLRNRMSRFCRFTTETPTGNEKDGGPFEWAIGAFAARRHWPTLRPLKVIVEYPFFRPDGTLASERGYDEATGIYLRAVGAPPVLPAVMDRAAALAAWDELADAVVDFPFAAPCHRSAWLSALLTPPARFAFSGPVPLYLVDGNAAGTGKGKLCNLIKIIMTGTPFPVTTPTNDDEEMRKRVTATAQSGATMELIDNIAGHLGGPVMDALMTATGWRDRLLGTNTIVTLPLFIQWFATGNNVQLAGDGVRRVNYTRFETKEANPEERSGFRHEHLEAWATTNRPRLLGAALTILGAYFAAGRPAVKLVRWGSYDEWSDIVRAAVVWLGLPDPAEGKQEMQAVADPIKTSLAVIIANWHLIDPRHKGLTSNQVIAKVFPEGKPDKTPPELADLAEAIQDICTRLTGQQLSKRFVQFRSANLGGKRLDRISKHANTIRWGIFNVGEVGEVSVGVSPELTPKSDSSSEENLPTSLERPTLTSPDSPVKPRTGTGFASLDDD